jgi:hypothetical protein
MLEIPDIEMHVTAPYTETYSVINPHGNHYRHCYYHHHRSRRRETAL